MQQHAPPAAFADLAQAAPPLRRRLEINLAGVLDRQHMPAPRRSLSLLAPAGEQGLQSHLLVGQKAAIADDLRAIAARMNWRARPCLREAQPPFIEAAIPEPA